MEPDNDDTLDGCEGDFGDTPDAEVDLVVLFAGVAPDDVEAHAQALRDCFR